MMFERLALLVLAAALFVGGCDLPQNEGSGGSGGDDDGEIRTWSRIRITDLSESEPSAQPGADIDAVVAFDGDTFLFAGCDEAKLQEQDTERYPESDHADPEYATLGVREADETGGFVSLAGGHLICDLPIPIRTGDTLQIWEMEEDGAESWSIAFRESTRDEFVERTSFVGSAEIAVP